MLQAQVDECVHNNASRYEKMVGGKYWGAMLGRACVQFHPIYLLGWIKNVKRHTLNVNKYWIYGLMSLD